MSKIGVEPLIRVLLLMENRLLRESLGRIFRKRADFLVLGSRGIEDSSPEKVFETQCDVVVLDFLDARWFPVNLRSKASNCSAPKFLLIAMSSNPQQFFEVVRGGVTGFLLKEPPSQMLSPPCGRRSEVRRSAQPNSADTYSSTSIKVPMAGHATDGPEYFRVHRQESCPPNHETG